MRAACRVLNSFAAEVAMDLDKQQIINDALAMAEKLDLGEHDYAIFDVHELGLKAVVRFTDTLLTSRWRRGILRMQGDSRTKAPEVRTNRSERKNGTGG
jgi:hypothetical protein